MQKPMPRRRGYKIIAFFDGAAASEYYVRTLQCFAVEVCNQQQWIIPCAQLLMHRIRKVNIELARGIPASFRREHAVYFSRYR